MSYPRSVTYDRRSLGLFRSLFKTPSSAFGTTILLLFLFLVVFGPLVSPYGPNEQIYTDTRQGPSLRHLFGTDLLGRDIFSRIIYGARSILSLTGLGALIAVAAGTAFGLFAGYRGGLPDEILMRLFDSVLAIPALLLALVLLGAVGGSKGSVLAVLAVVYTPIVARVVRSETLAIKRQGFVEAARLQGESTPWILFREILPCVLPALSVEAALRFSYGIFLVASLGYLGIGVQPPTPDWGMMVREARDAARLTPWALYFPAGAISLLVISINLTADGLKRALLRTEGGTTMRARRRVMRARRRSITDADSSSASPALLSFNGMTASYAVGGRWLDAVRDVSLDVREGETIGLVGESGSGKSTLALAAVRYLAGNGAVRSGAVRFSGRDVYRLGPRELRDLRGRRIGLIPQDPLASLNPSIRVGEQVAEILRWHGVKRDVARSRTRRLLEHVRIADPSRVARQYPHQLSGGMQQRITIAMGLSTTPQLLLLDEPTTGLDVTTEAAILDLLEGLLVEGDRGSLYISHDLGLVSRIVDRVAVLYAGELVEVGDRQSVFDSPRHPYTLGLLQSIPHVTAGPRVDRLPSMPGGIPPLDGLPEGCVFGPRCPLRADICSVRPDLSSAGPGRLSRCHRMDEVGKGPDGAARPIIAGSAKPTMDVAQVALRARDLSVSFPLPRTLADSVRRRPRRSLHAVEGVSLDIESARTVGLVGESGSGKTTFARALLGLDVLDSGVVETGDRVLSPALARRTRDDLRRLQAVAQSPDQALHPYRSIGATLARPFIRLSRMSRADAIRNAREILGRVGLSPDYASRLPGQLSGGEKQRVAIARAFSSGPAVVLCDEVTSSLDVSVQALVLNLLRDLQDEYAGAYLFITHDLAVVAHLADRLAVMCLGELMEVGPRSRVLAPPYHPYTEALLGAYPGFGRVDGERPTRLSGEVPSPVDRPSGCSFHTRCPRRLGSVCFTEAPPWRRGISDHSIRCHIPLEELEACQAPLFGAMRGLHEPREAAP